MRRLLRILLNAATVLSLVLCMVTMAAWVRSYQVRDEGWWSMAKPRLIVGIGTYRGGLFAGVTTPVGDEDDLRRPGARWVSSGPLSHTQAYMTMSTNRFGFACDYFEDGANATRNLTCPYWFIMLLTAILPTARLAGWRRRARRLRMRPGLCRHCGYDCRATPDRCPECGTPAAAG